MKTLTLDINPVPKPRMTQSDKWKKRPCVLKYRSFCDELRYLVKQEKIDLEVLARDGFKLVFYMPMPLSWGKKKRLEMKGTPHMSRPDVDNLMKSYCDALYKEDSHIWNVHVVKKWNSEASIYISELM
ncbi:RusA family crossover junction endodeoxyribonuclease [Candidatus Pacearchaeota archaeon]|nr:RusA family crossover junction endodeoxyribonuclease [Candidatus Pacearchaeota archaeon]